MLVNIRKSPEELRNMSEEEYASFTDELNAALSEHCPYRLRYNGNVYNTNDKNSKDLIKYHKRIAGVFSVKITIKSLSVFVTYDESLPDRVMGLAVQDSARNFDLASFRFEIDKEVGSGFRCGRCWSLSMANGTCLECESRKAGVNVKRERIKDRLIKI